MGRQGKVAPISKDYNSTFNSMDQQLAKEGFTRFPGTTEMFFPYKENSGKYRTGLDVSAPHLNRLSAEDRKAEIKRIEEDKKRLEDKLGVPGLLDSNSPFYNFAASKEQLKKRFETELQVSPIKMGTQEEFFNLDDAMAEITWNWIKVHPRIAPSLDSYRKGDVPSEVKYYIVDDEAETKETYNRKREINTAIVEFEKLTPTKKKQIARLLGLPVTESTKEEQVYNLIDTQLKETEFREGKNKGLAPVRLFKELLATTDERIKVKDLVEQALTHSIYRIGNGGKILEGGVPIATSKEELVEHLLDEANQVDLLALDKKLTSKKIEKA